MSLFDLYWAVSIDGVPCVTNLPFWKAPIEQKVNQNSLKLTSYAFIGIPWYANSYRAQIHRWYQSVQLLHYATLQFLKAFLLEPL